MVFSESCDPSELISRSQFGVRWDSSIVFGSKTLHLERNVGGKEQFGGLGVKCSELASNLGGHTHMKHFIFLQKRRPYIGLEDHFTLIKFCSLIECLSCTKATGVENRPPARVRANTKIALRGKSHQFPAQRPNLSIRDLNNRKMARQSFLRFL